MAITLAQMHEVLAQAIGELPWTQGLVFVYDEMRESLPSPSVSIELTEGDVADSKSGSEALDMALRWVARVVVLATIEQAELRVREYAFALAKALKNLGTVGGGAGILRVVRVCKDEFKEPLNGYLTWMVEFEFDAPVGAQDDAGEPTMTEMELTLVKHCCTGDERVEIERFLAGEGEDG